MKTWGASHHLLKMHVVWRRAVTAWVLLVVCCQIRGPQETERGLFSAPVSKWGPVGGGGGGQGGDCGVILGWRRERAVSCSSCGYWVPVKHRVRQLNTGTSAGNTGIALRDASARVRAGPLHHSVRQLNVPRRIQKCTRHTSAFCKPCRESHQSLESSHSTFRHI